MNDAVVADILEYNQNNIVFTDADRRERNKASAMNYYKIPLTKEKAEHIKFKDK